MDVENFRIIESKKYMWDGKTYESEKEGQDIKKRYEKADFEAELIEENGKYLVYSRRVVTEIVLEGEAPV